MVKGINRQSEAVIRRFFARLTLAASCTLLAAAAPASGPSGAPTGPPSLGLTTAALTFQDNFKTLSRTTDLSDTSAVWQTRLWFGCPYCRTGGFAGVYLDESIPLPDGSVRNPFARSQPGLLDITAAYLDGATPANYPPRLTYQGGILTTLGSFHQDYGYYEITMQCAGGTGAESAFFGYPYFDYTTHVKTGSTFELDFQEQIGSAPMLWTTSRHSRATTQNTGSIYTNTGVNLQSGFHVYGTLWAPAGLTRFLDNVQIDNTPILNPPNFTTPIFLVIAHDVDKPASPVWNGNPSSPAGYPKEMLVKSVRVFRTADTTVAGGSAALQTVP